MTPEEIFSKLQTLIAEQFNMDPDENKMSTSFVDDLGADSVDLVELVMGMEEAFELEGLEDEDADLAQLKTVGDCVKFLNGKLN